MKLAINKKGVLFDLDGVISDTQDMHAEVESKFLRSLNIEIQPHEISARFAGVGDKQMFSTVFAEHGVSHSVDEINKQKWNMMGQMIEKYGIKAIPDAVELIERLHKNGFVLAIASGSPKTFIEKVIDVLSIGKYFNSFVSSEEVLHGKPAPDVFLEAAKRAQIDANNCVIIEDGLSGMQAAVSANIPCIGLVKDKSKSYPATILVTSLNEVTLDVVDQLLGCKSKISA